MRARSVAAALLAAGLLGVFSALPAHAATHAITMANYAFSPSGETIASGDSVTWTNTDQAPHDVTVTSGPVAIHSPTITTGQSWTYTFTTAGTYSYICSIHPDMHATLVVTAPPTHSAAVPPPATQRTLTPTRTRSTPAQAAAPMPVATSTPSPSAAAASPAAQSPAPTQAVPSAQSAPPSTLNPLLLVAGLVAAVATLCLLLLGSRPEKQQE